jgi:hypothetical protein
MRMRSIGEKPARSGEFSKILLMSKFLMLESFSKDLVSRARQLGSLVTHLQEGFFQLLRTAVVDESLLLHSP